MRNLECHPGEDGVRQRCSSLLYYCGRGAWTEILLRDRGRKILRTNLTMVCLSIDGGHDIRPSGRFFALAFDVIDRPSFTLS